MTSDGTPNGAIAESGLTYNFDTKTLSVSGSVQFDVAYSGLTEEAKTHWNPTDGTLDLGMKGGQLIQHIGQQLYYPPVVNKSGDILYRGTLLMINSIQPSFGNRLSVVKCISDGTFPSYSLVGVLTEDLLDNSEGFATWFGYVRSLNVNQLQDNGIKPSGETWNSGNTLWANPNLDGGYTNVEPYSPNLKIPVAAISNVNGNNITIVVRPTLNPRLNELSNIQTSGQTNGDILVFNNTLGYWEYTKNLVGDYTISGNTIQYGSEFSRSVIMTGVTSGDTQVVILPVSGGCSADFNYYVHEIGGAMRAGTIKSVWNNSSAGYTDVSTTDIDGSTSDLEFVVEVIGTNVILKTVIFDGIWEIKISSKIIL